MSALWFCQKKETPDGKVCRGVFQVKDPVQCGVESSGGRGDKRASCASNVPL